MKIEKHEQKLVDKDVGKGYGKFGYGVGLVDIILITLWICPGLIVILAVLIFEVIN